MIDNQARPIAFVMADTEYGSLILNRLDSYQGSGISALLFEQGAHDRYEIARIKELLDSLLQTRGAGLTVVDCGANIGTHTIAMARHMYGWGRVLAFEPQERIYYALAGNIALANLFNASAIHAAVGKADGTIMIPVPNYLSPGTFGGLELQPKGRPEYIGQPISYAPKDLRPVRLISIDDRGLPRVDYIKIDVEGMEMEVLEGADRTIRRDHPTMWIEWIKSDKEAMRAWLEERGYAVTEFGINFVAEAQ